jgi:pimeloyl-ACP methyl ester carboxylesterase
MHRASRAVAGVLCLGLLTACASSEPPAPSTVSAKSVPSTTAAPVASAPTTSLVGTTAARARALAGRPMLDCTIQSEAPVTATAPAVCGILEVPEDRSNPSGRMIGLRVAVIPAEGDSPAPDAFFALAGGPGRAATAFFGWLPGLFADVHATRDVVLVDQRGTGGSNALVLPPMPDTTGLSQAEVDAHLQTWSHDWLASIGADPRQYTSSVAADDLDAVRTALGYELIDLYGPSYGATVAQYYIRQHPDHVRVAIMDGGTPLDVQVLERMAANSQAALELLFDRCAKDAACHAALPDLSSEWSQLAAALAAGINTSLTDPNTGQPAVATLEQVGPGIHQALLDPSTAARLPLAIHLTHEGQWQQAVQILPASTGNGDSLAMSEIIMCSEAWARFDPAEVEHLGHGSYLLPAHLTQAAARAQRCKALPPGVVPANDAAPVATALPILWLTGDGDPQDPPANLTSIPSQQPNARIVIMPAQQHTVGHSGCGPRVIAEFVDAGTAHGLDTACTAHAAVPGLTFMLP